MSMTHYNVMIFKKDKLTPTEWSTDDYDSHCGKRVFETRYFSEWDEFVAFLRDTHKKTLKCKNDNLHMLSGYSITGYKSKDSILHTMRWLACDFDEFSSPGKMSATDFFKFLNKLDYEYVAYNTASCQKDKPRMRVVFHLSRTVNKLEYKQFIKNFNKILRSMMDIQTLHIERTQGLPASFEGAYNFFYHKRGNEVDVSETIKKYPEFVPQPKIKVKWIEERDNAGKKRLDWNNIHDCPIINTNLYNELLSQIQKDGTGRYHNIFRLICSMVGLAKAKNYIVDSSDITDILKSSQPLWSYLKSKGRDRNIKKEIDNAFKQIS